MKNKTFVFICLLLIQQIVVATDKIDWGSTGHRAVGQIAENNLSKHVVRKIKKLLGGQGLAMVSTFADDIKSDKRYNEFYSWHYVNLDDGDTYQTSKKNPKGDLVTGIQKCKQILLDKNSSKDDKIFYLKMLIHLIGDLHQPLHVGRYEDKGGNTFQVQWFGKGSNLHKVWDSQMINSFDMTYSELANNTNKLTKKQIKEIQKGTVVDWVNETKQLAQKVYTSAKKGEDLKYRYMYDHFEMLRSQLQKGGLRLAKVLNDIF